MSSSASSFSIGEAPTNSEKANGMELKLRDIDKIYDAHKLLQLLTPKSYDISDVDSPVLYPK